MVLWMRGAIFTLVAPVLVAGAVPWWIDPDRELRSFPWAAGWLVVAAGAVIYVMCLRRFLTAGGTPAIFFTRPIRFLIGEEPRRVVRSGLYARTRNPMYLGVLLAVAGQAIAFESRSIAIYAALLAAGFHLIVVLIEEPHLKAERGDAYADYVRRVPRWF